MRVSAGAFDCKLTAAIAVLYNNTMLEILAGGSEANWKLLRKPAGSLQSFDADKPMHLPLCPPELYETGTQGQVHPDPSYGSPTRYRLLRLHAQACSP